jgi:hypothetical protein
MLKIGEKRSKGPKSSKLYIMSFFILLDLALNSSVDYDTYSQGKNDMLVLGLLGLQVITQICVFLVLFLTLADTFLFRVGLLGLLVRKIRVVLVFQVIYLIITVVTGLSRIKHYGARKSLMALTEDSTFTGLSSTQKIRK